MVQEDTVKLLRECIAGVKMGIASIEEVIDKVKSAPLKDMLLECVREHHQLGKEIDGLLSDYNEQEKEPNIMAKGMSWIKTNVMMSMDNNDNTIADVITDGCNMGVKALNRYMNKYKNADSHSKELAKRLINSEHKLSIDLRPFL